MRMTARRPFLRRHSRSSGSATSVACRGIPPEIMGVAMADAGSILGNSVVRLEDPALLTGAGKYVDDLDSPSAARVVFVRSSVAHGTLRSVDVAGAKSMPGVLAVYHAGGDDLGLAPFQGFPMIPEVFNRPVFARDRVRFVGDIVAAVVAES